MSPRNVPMSPRTTTAVGGEEYTNSPQLERSTFTTPFLDRDRQYSCAYFRRPEDSLDAAQENKKALIAAKLLLEPGQRVLDIGCGTGLSGEVLDEGGHQWVGMDISRDMLNVAQEREVEGETQLSRVERY